MEALAAGVPVLAVPQTPEQRCGPRSTSDFGVYRSDDEGAHWFPVGRDLPADANAEQVFDRVLADYPALYRRIRDEQGRIRRHVNVFLEEENLRRSSLDQVPVPPGSRIHVLPCISGG
jgi:hypothetical protein